jgi:hypothetical protein
VNPRSLLRWTTFIENGPFFSISREAYPCAWGFMSPRHVTGWGFDFGVCLYLTDVCGFDPREACAVVDAHPVEHANTHTASSKSFRGMTYNDKGFQDQLEYGSRVAPRLNSPFPKTGLGFREIDRIRKPKEEWV